MPKYQYAKPYDFIREVATLKSNLKQAQIRLSNNINSAAIQQDATALSNSNIAGTTLITVGWGIAINDATVGTCYTIETDFDGIFENQTLSWQLILDGSVEATTGVGASFLTAGSGFNGTMRGRIRVVSVGSSGLVNCALDGGAGINAVRLDGSSSNQAYLSNLNKNVAYDTTTTHVLSIATVWGGSNASQTIGTYGSIFTRQGSQVGS